MLWREDRSRLPILGSVVAAVAAVAVGVLVWALPEAIRFLPGAPSGFWALTLAALIVDIPLFGLTPAADYRVRTTLSVCFTFAIFLLWGGGPAIAVQALAATVSVIGQRYHPVASVYMVSRLVCAAAAANLVAYLADMRPITTVGTGINGGDLLAFTVLATVWFAVSYGLLLLGRAIVTPGGLRQTARELRLDLVVTAAAAFVVAPFLTTMEGWLKLGVVAPLLVLNVVAREQQRRERRLGREPLSGLLNLQGLMERMQGLTAGDRVARSGPRPFGLILVNLESVLQITRTLGRELSEKVVDVAARRVMQAYGTERAARLSSDDLLILGPDLTEENAVSATEEAVGLLEPAIEVDGIPFALNPAGGVALSPLHDRDVGGLLVKAEFAAGEARRARQRAVLYVPGASEAVERRTALLRELSSVLSDPARHDEIAVLYQPQIDIVSGRLAGVEALLRWTHPAWGPVPTEELIHAIEFSEIMHLLTWHMLATVTAQARRWNEQGEPVRVSVNVSVRDLTQPNFVETLGTLVDRNGIGRRQLVVEITESTLITDAERVSEVARRLATRGVGLSLDDFGTGYASLQQLRQLPLTEVKVDRSYVRGMVDNPADVSIMTSVYQLTRALHFDMVAEGVEDQRIVDALARMPGVLGQGWHFGRPMTVDDLHDWRRQRRYRAEPRRRPALRGGGHE